MWVVMAVRAVLKVPFEKVAPLPFRYPCSLYTVNHFTSTTLMGPTSQVEQLEGT